MVSNFDYEAARENVFKYMGGEADEFLSGVQDKLARSAEKWQLSQLSFMQTDTANLLFSCTSVLHGSCILKLCISGYLAITEINCLQAYGGNGYVKLWEYDLADNIMLLERVTPGNQMWDVPDYKERARLMAELIKALPFVAHPQCNYPSFKSWMEKNHSHMTNMGNVDDILFYLNKALLIYDELKKKYPRSCLLHGDMHQENLLLNQQGGYTIIDPQGVVDDPVMETARFLNNEMSGDAEKIKEIAAIMSPIIGVPEGDILKGMFIDIAIMRSWSMEEHFPSQEAFEKEKLEAVADCKFVFEMLG